MYISLYFYNKIIYKDYVIGICKSKYKKKYKHDKLLLLNHYNGLNHKSLGLYYYISDLDVYVFICFTHFYELGYRIYNIFEADVFIYHETTNLRQVKSVMLSFSTYEIIKDIKFIVENSFLL